MFDTVVSGTERDTMLLQVPPCLLHPHTPSEDSWAARGTGPMLAGIADKAYRSPVVPRGESTKNSLCMCVLHSRPCYSACSIVWLLTGFLPAGTQLRLTDTVLFKVFS